MKATLTPLDSNNKLARLESEWLALENTLQPTSFLRWSWIGSWLRTLAQHSENYLFRVSQDDEIVGLAILVHSRFRRRGFFTVSRLTLHETGDAHYQAVIENNAILSAPEQSSTVLGLLLDVLSSQPDLWQEITMPSSNYLRKDFPNSGLRLINEDTFTSRQAVNIDGSRFLEGKILSKNKRWQIRRSVGFYREAFGAEPELHLAASAEQALAWFEKMGMLHSRYWLGRNHSGSFVNRAWVAFHRDIIEQGFERGDIQMLRVAAGDNDIGFLYNLTAGGRCSNIQSGFKYEDDNRARPGLMSHALAVQYNFDNGNNVYDFLMGDSPYKISLSNECAEVTTWILQKKTFALRVEALLLAVVRRVRKLAYSRR